MKILVIYCHPWQGSYNFALLKSFIDGLELSKQTYEVIDLNKENFNSVLSEADLALYSKGETTDKQVKIYQQKIQEASHLVFIFPIWWGFMPAVMKGFIDKVFLKKWAYDFKGILPVGKLTWIKKATIINTMNAPGIFYKLFLSKAVKQAFINSTLKFCGIKNIKWIKFANVINVSNKKRKKWLEKIKNYAKILI